MTRLLFLGVCLLAIVSSIPVALHRGGSRPGMSDADSLVNTSLIESGNRAGLSMPDPSWSFCFDVTIKFMAGPVPMFISIGGDASLHMSGSDDLAHAMATGNLPTAGGDVTFTGKMAIGIGGTGISLSAWMMGSIKIGVDLQGSVNHAGALITNSLKSFGMTMLKRKRKHNIKTINKVNAKLTDALDWIQTSTPRDAARSRSGKSDLDGFVPADMVSTIPETQLFYSCLLAFSNFFTDIYDNRETVEDLRAPQRNTKTLDQLVLEAFYKHFTKKNGIRGWGDSFSNNYYTKDFKCTEVAPDGADLRTMQAGPAGAFDRRTYNEEVASYLLCNIMKQGAMLTAKPAKDSAAVLAGLKLLVPSLFPEDVDSNAGLDYPTFSPWVEVVSSMVRRKKNSAEPCNPPARTGHPPATDCEDEHIYLTRLTEFPVAAALAEFLTEGMQKDNVVTDTAWPSLWSVEYKAAFGLTLGVGKLGNLCQPGTFELTGYVSWENSAAINFATRSFEWANSKAIKTYNVQLRVSDYVSITVTKPAKTSDKIFDDIKVAIIARAKVTKEILDKWQEGLTEASTVLSKIKSLSALSGRASSTGSDPVAQALNNVALQICGGGAVDRLGRETNRLSVKERVKLGLEALFTGISPSWTTLGELFNQLQANEKKSGSSTLFGLAGGGLDSLKAALEDVSGIGGLADKYFVGAAIEFTRSGGQFKECAFKVLTDERKALTFPLAGLTGGGVTVTLTAQEEQQFVVAQYPTRQCCSKNGADFTLPASFKCGAIDGGCGTTPWVEQDDDARATCQGNSLCSSQTPCGRSCPWRVNDWSGEGKDAVQAKFERLLGATEMDASQ